MSIEELTRELAAPKRRMDAAEVRLNEVSGQFEFISGQLRDASRTMIAHFAVVAERFDAHDRRLDSIDAKLADHDRGFDQIDAALHALPGAIAELIHKRLGAGRGDLAHHNHDVGVAGHS